MLMHLNHKPCSEPQGNEGNSWDIRDVDSRTGSATNLVVTPRQLTSAFTFRFHTQVYKWGSDRHSESENLILYSFNFMNNS